MAISGTYPTLHSPPMFLRIYLGGVITKYTSYVRSLHPPLRHLHLVLILSKHPFYPDPPLFKKSQKKTPPSPPAQYHLSSTNPSTPSSHAHGTKPQHDITTHTNPTRIVTIHDTRCAHPSQCGLSLCESLIAVLYCRYASFRVLQKIKGTAREMGHPLSHPIIHTSQL